MKLGAIALDYDGTIATHGVMHPDVRAAVGAARDAGIAVILATGRRLDDLKQVAGDLGCFDAVVAENGAASRSMSASASSRPMPECREPLSRSSTPFSSRCVAGKAFRALSPSDLYGQTLITYRVSTLSESVTLPDDAVVLVTRETDSHEIAALRGLCRKPGAAVSPRAFPDLQVNEAAILPGAVESGGCVKRTRAGTRGEHPGGRGRGAYRHDRPDDPRAL